MGSSLLPPVEIWPILVHGIRFVLHVSYKTMDVAASTKFDVSHRWLKWTWLQFGFCSPAESIGEVMVKISKSFRCIFFIYFTCLSAKLMKGLCSSQILIYSLSSFLDLFSLIKVKFFSNISTENVTLFLTSSQSV